MNDSANADPGAARLAAIDALFTRALDRPPAERAGFVAAEAGDDLELRRAVEELLAAAVEGGETLAPGGALGAHLWDDLSQRVAGGDALRAGETVGRYRVIEEIGRGGMSVVYLAERTDGGFRQQVALKVLKRGSDTDEVLRRFAQERQILAALTHPGISRLLDGGVTLDGRPYFALERVEGIPIGRYCEERELPLEERLRLVIQVGRAVEHAHRRLVVHRDLKPSNILVDGDGQVKLLDFGIAKLVDPEGWGDTVPLTRTHMRLLTPEYASPEQVRGEPVTTATDIYQLGLLLYELLTGQRPYRLRRGGHAELERAICEDEPAPPSTAVTETDRLPAASPETGRPPTRRRRLRRHLKGDLDNIVLKALRKEPERRYGSVCELVEDLQRFLDGRPVLARGDTLAYRAAKFVRRHALGLGAAAAVLLLAVGMSAVYAVRLAEERDRARQEATKAERVAQTLTRLFEVADPADTPGTAITAHELLDRGLETMERELAGEPQLRAEMQLKVALMYKQLGLYDRALEVVAPAAEVLRGELGPDDPKLAEAHWLHGLMLYQTGDLAGSRPHFVQAVRGFELAGSHAREHAMALNGLANLEKRQGNLATSRRLFEQALELQTATLGPDHEDVGKTYNNLALTLDILDEYEVARDALERSLAIRQRHYPGDDRLAATTLGNLAQVYRKLGDLDAAQRAVDASRSMLLATVGEDHPDLAEVHNAQGILHLKRGELEAAVEAFERSIALYERTLGSDHFHLAYPIGNLGDAYADLGRWEEAERSYRRALELRLRTLGPQHDLIGQIKSKLARVARANGDIESAEALLREALSIVRAVFDPPNKDVADRLFELGDLLLEQGRPAEAEPLLREALPIFEAYDSPRAAPAREALERCRAAPG